MKLKDIEGLMPDCFRKADEHIPDDKEVAYDLGQGDYKLDIGEKEIEIDVDRLEDIILDATQVYEGKGKKGILNFIASVNVVAQAIAKECPIRLRGKA